MEALNLRWLVFVAALIPTQALATTYVGSDLGGTDLILLDGDVLEGAFTNVGTFWVTAGATVFVQREIHLEVHADTILIDGSLSAEGAGDRGGQPGLSPGAGAIAGFNGFGLGFGGLGGPGNCVHGGGGGGGGHAGRGGEGAYYFGGADIGDPGTTYGWGGSPFELISDRPFGSGGGGGGSGCTPADGTMGGSGGGSVLLEATLITVTGVVTVSGQSASAVVTGAAGGGGGGSGGTLVLLSGVIDGGGNLEANGGAGGDCLLGAGGLAGGGGGGGGGRIKLFTSPGYLVNTEARGGTFGVSQAGGYDATVGGAGTVVQETYDSDGDGLLDTNDNCPTIPNADQADANGNGVGDVCDVCGSTPDPDADGVCDPFDHCPGFDDNADNDGDTVPDGCDVCLAGDDNADQDGDLVPDDCDICAIEPNQNDVDNDGMPDACDICPNFDDFIDADSDGAPDGCDICPGGFDGNDADGDTLPNDCDQCDGFDDSIDADSDGAPDGCDVCPTQPDPDQLDGDGDGYGIACDCDDEDNDIGPGVVEVCDGTDNDCDGEIDNNAIDANEWYADVDEDGEGDPLMPLMACEQPEGYVSNNTDCDDTLFTVRSSAAEVCDGIDNDCDGEIDFDDCVLADDEPIVDTTASLVGCGCTSAPTGPSGVLAFLPLLLAGLRRRRTA
ncbi:MAG: hypothetical protein GWP91_03965 [Rhodobacterales bacterium]|nr:hypothetical protein [Rhodobacterales bacterium]